MSLKAARTAARLTQVQLSRLSGVSQSAIAAIEVAQDEGRDRDVSLKTARALVKALRSGKHGLKKLTLDDLFPEAQ